MTKFAEDSDCGIPDEADDIDIADIPLIGDEDAEAHDSDVQYDDGACEKGEEAAEPGVAF